MRCVKNSPTCDKFDVQIKSIAHRPRGASWLTSRLSSSLVTTFTLAVLPPNVCSCKRTLNHKYSTRHSKYLYSPTLYIILIIVTFTNIMWIHFMCIWQITYIIPNQMFALLYTPAYLYELLRDFFLFNKKEVCCSFVCFFKIHLIEPQNPPVAAGMRLQHLAITKIIKNKKLWWMALCVISVVLT